MDDATGKKLFVVRLEYETIVLADNEADAVATARLDAVRREEPTDDDAREARDVEDVPPRLRDCLPWRDTDCEPRLRTPREYTAREWLERRAHGRTLLGPGDGAPLL